jgi:hypothetical protein
LAVQQVAMEVFTRMETAKLKVFSSLLDWFEE